MKKHVTRLLLAAMLLQGPAFGTGAFPPSVMAAEEAAVWDAEAVPETDAVDYSLPENWAYYEDAGDKDADVFLVCPTVDVKDEYHMSLEDDETKGNFLGALNMERGIYDEEARMFSPYYRQAAMKAYELPEKEREACLDSAYRDVSEAFSWYLEHENGGRPIVLAGFSQGADMCYRLLEEYFGDEELFGRLVAVYAIGWPLREELAKAYPQIVPASGPDDTGVVVSFECEAPGVSGSFVVPEGTRAYAINPLNWKTDGTIAGKEENLGACFTDYSGAVTREEKGLCGCYLEGERSILKVTDIDPADYPALISLLPEGAYHIYDYQFFYRNLQENVRTRISAYMEKNGYISDDIAA